jgi:cerevisin
MSKILDDTGEGNTAVVLAALDVIQEYFLSRKRPAVLSMSLGGDCDGGRTALACMHDPIVLAVERLSALGMVASVAAGNDRASACHGSPNSASSAVNVGATNIDDETAYFSNIGEYIAFLITK